MPILLATDEHGMTTVERHMNGAIVVASFAARLGLQLGCELLVPRTCLTCSTTCLVLSSSVGKYRAVSEEKKNERRWSTPALPPIPGRPRTPKNPDNFFAISFSVSLFYPMYICIYPLKYSQLQVILFLEISDTLGGTRLEEHDRGHARSVQRWGANWRDHEFLQSCQSGHLVHRVLFSSSSREEAHPQHRHS